MPTIEARRARVIQAAELSRMTGGRRRRRKRLPKPAGTKGLERQYTRTLLRMLREAREYLQPLLDELPTLLRNAAADRERFDVGEGGRIRQLIEEATARMGATFSNSQLEALSARFALDVSAHQKLQFQRELRAVLGADVFVSDRGLAAIADAFVTENVALIKSLPVKVYTEIEGEVTRAVTAGLPHKELAKRIHARFSVGESRARLIARDQVGKYYGKVAETRQRAVGVDRFIWRTANDERVRDEHAARDGEVYTWRNAPEGGPGAAINCRCYAEPVLDDILQ